MSAINTFLIFAAASGALIASVYFVKIVRSLVKSLRALKAQQRRLDVERDFYETDVQRARQALLERREAQARIEKQILEGQTRLKEAESIPAPFMYLIEDVPNSDADRLFGVRIAAKPEARLRPEDGFNDNVKHAAVFGLDPGDAAMRATDAHQPFTDFIVTPGQLLP